MGVLAEKYRPGDIERTTRELWAARGLPGADGIIGRSTSPIVHQFEGALITGDDPGLVVFRAVAADVDARYLALAGRRALGTLHKYGELDEPTISLLRALSVWTGGSAGAPVDSADRRAAVETILGRMAALGLVATRDTSLRVCPSCAQARTPDRIIYQQEEGDTYLVRFPVPEGDGVVHALAWVDAPWRLLGASALLVNPTLPYVVARYRRRGVDEKILTSRPSLARLLEWLPGGEIEVLEEGTGARWQGRPYQYPLRHEFPMGGELTPPSGTILAVADVTDSGTGIVPLVPGHGGSDAQIADRLGIAGWPLVTLRGQLSFDIAHKYSGLDLPTANEFVARDLAEGGALFARLRVRRGVPHCTICGTAMVWAPGRAWCLEPSRLPAERRDLYRRLLPKDPAVGQVEVAAWPISEPQSAPPGPYTVTLLECPRCERLGPLGGGPECACGNRRNPVGRRLLPSMAGILGGWARFDPFPAGDSVWLYLNERRRAPALVHHLSAMSGVVGVPNDVGLALLPGVPEGGVVELAGSLGADAVRAALVRGEQRERSGPTFPDRCRQEARRLERWWNVARELLDRCDPALLAAFAQPIAGSLGELESEDRAILARWERVRLATLADYDHQAAGSAYRRLAAFLANDLETYVARVRPRLDRAGTPPSRRAALRTLHHMLREVTVVLAPVSPHVAETVYAALVPGRTSLFEASIDPLDSTLLDEEAIKAWDRWASIEQAVERFRRRVGLDPDTPIPSLAAIVASDDLAASLRADRPTLQRLTRVTRFEAFGPATPWTGRQRSLAPVISEIQKAYPQEAGQILHVLRRMPVRRRGEGAASEELSVVVRGLSRRILPSMVEYVEMLPERVVALPWTLGELYAELPAQQPVPLRNPPPVSPDAFRLLSRVERELRRTASLAQGERGPILIAVLDPLAAELRSSARALATYLGVSEVRILDPSAEFPRTNCWFGRTRTGVHWWVRFSDGAARPAHEKHRVQRARLSRVRPHRPGTAGAIGEVDYASEEEVAKEEQIRSLVQELDGVLGAPLLGPAKVGGAWTAGLRTMEDFSRAPFDRINQLPGFGGPIAESLVRKLGGSVPPRPIRPLPRPRGLGDGSTAVALVSGSDRADDFVEVPPPSPGSRSGAGTPLDTSGPATRASPEKVRLAPPPVTPPRPTTGNVVPPSAPEPPRLPESPSGATPPVSPRAFEPTPGGSLPVLPESEFESPPALDGASSATQPPSIPPTGTPASDSTVGPAAGAIEPPPPTAAPSPAPSEGDAPLPSPEESPPEPPRPSVDLPPDYPFPPPMDPTPASEGSPPDSALLADAGPDRMPEQNLAEVSGVPPDGVARSALPQTATEIGSGSAGGTGTSEPMPPRSEVAPVPAETEDLSVELVPNSPPTSEEPAAPVESGETDTPPASPAGAEYRPPDRSAPTDVAPGTSEGPSRSEPPVGAVTAPPALPSDPLTDQAEADTAPFTPPESPETDVAPPETMDAPHPPSGPELSDVPERVTPVETPTEPTLPDSLPPETLQGAAALPEPVLVEVPTVESAPVESGLGIEPASPTAPEPAPLPPIPEAPPEPLPPPTPSGGVTLVVAPSFLPAFTEFLDATAAGHRGICIVRESPDRLRAHVGPRPVEIYWLTNIGRGLTLRPNDLDAYGAFLTKAVDQDRVTAVFLEGIEYLTRVHGTERVIERLAAFHVEAQAHNARVWVYLHPDLIPAADLALFTAAFGNGPSND